ncbi:MAG: biotin/lipoate A/B protein ligase family protein [Nitrospirota bacterium]
MNFIRIINDGAAPAFFNMALDEAISECVRQKASPPTLRLYEWDRPSLSIGCFQKISDIDTAYCREKGYPVVRRPSGGRAVLHDSELTYSFSSPADAPVFNSSLLENYAVISRALLSALKMIGIEAEASSNRKRGGGIRHPACFRAVSYGEISVGGKKLIGSAQKRYRDGFLQHGSILLSFRPEIMCKVLGEDLDDNFHDIGGINDGEGTISVNNLRAALKEAFEKTLNVKLISDVPTKSELALAKQLERTKYSTGEWNFSR